MIYMPRNVCTKLFGAAKDALHGVPNGDLVRMLRIVSLVNMCSVELSTLASMSKTYRTIYVKDLFTTIEFFAHMFLTHMIT